MKQRLLTAELVAAEYDSGKRRVSAPRGEVVVTPGAWSKAQELGVVIDRSGVASDAAACERVVDASGAVLVRGRSVQLAHFEPSGKNVGLADVVTGKDKAPMTAGFMSWAREDSFDWALDYDEVDYVVEGVLQLGLGGGRVLEGRAGDVLYIPKGTQVRFGTPNRVRVFYVTYPANWAG